MLFWHVGATIAFVRYTFRDKAMDLRFLALGAILPDLIDTPIGAIGWSAYATVRLWSHGIVFVSLLLVTVLVATRRGPVRKRWILLSTGVVLHILLDAMWSQPETLWWPMLTGGFTSSGFATFGGYVSDVITDPLMWLGEAIGLTYLVALWRKSALGDSAARRTLLRSGTVSAGIGRQ